MTDIESHLQAWPCGCTPNRHGMHGTDCKHPTTESSEQVPDHAATLLTSCARDQHHWALARTALHYQNLRHLQCLVCDAVVALPTENGKVVSRG